MKRERDEDADADDETASLVGHDDADVVFTNEKSRKRVRMSVDETMRREVIVLDD